MSRIVQVTAAILTKAGRVLIARRGPGSHQAGKWEFPGGKIEAGETPEACLKREMMEEFNIDVSVAEFLGTSVYHYDHISIELMAFRTRWIGGDLMASEHAAIAWVNVNELGGYDFAPADLPFVEKMKTGAVGLEDFLPKG